MPDPSNPTKPIPHPPGHDPETMAATVTLIHPHTKEEVTVPNSELTPYMHRGFVQKPPDGVDLVESNSGTTIDTGPAPEIPGEVPAGAAFPLKSAALAAVAPPVASAPARTTVPASAPTSTPTPTKKEG